jgi:protein-S-isoprenylcysteine O-methyltransferase Ste14
MKTTGLHIQSWILVVVQFSCLIILFFTGPVFLHQLIHVIIEIISIILGFWAIFVTNPQTINVFPDVRKEATFVGIGPYRYIRHPMYLAVILLSLSLTLEKSTLFRIIVLLVLIADLLYKIEYEEKILMNSFKEYKEYRTHTKKLIPFIY